MKSIHLIVVTLALAALSGCATRNEPGKVLSTSEDPAVRASLAQKAANAQAAAQPSMKRYLATYDTVNNASSQADANDTALVLPGTSRMYFAAPSRDPLNPKVIHGDHVIVRAEEDARPLLASQSARRVVVGNAVDGSLHYAPAVLEREMAEEVARTRTQNAQVLAQNEQTKQLVMASAKTLAEVNRANQELRQQNLEIVTALQKQTAYSKDLQDELARMKAAQQQPTAGPQTGPKAQKPATPASAPANQSTAPKQGASGVANALP